MRFHVGFSFRGKVILKWLAALAVALLSFFGISQLQVVYANDNIPAHCQQGGVTDMISCSAFTDYYEIPSSSTSCNVFLGDHETGNLRTRQTEYYINYLGPFFLLTSTSNVNKGTAQNNLAVRFKREEDKPYYLSYNIKNSNSLACQNVNGRTCAPPGLQIFLCPDSTYTNCHLINLDYYSFEDTSHNGLGLSYETLQNGTTIMSSGIRNIPIPTSSQINNTYCSTSHPCNYIQINYSTTYQNYGLYQDVNVGATWVYDYVLMTDEQIDWSLSENDITQKALNYCEGVSTGDFIQGGGNSVLDKTTEQIISEVTNSDAINGANSMSEDLFDTQINNHGVTDIVTAPITLLQGMLSASESCSPLTFNISLLGEIKSVSFPCGSILWDNVPSSVESIVNVTIWGLLGFYVCLDLYKFVQDLHDPDKKNDYIMEL